MFAPARIIMNLSNADHHFTSMQLILFNLFETIDEKKESPKCVRKQKSIKILLYCCKVSSFFKQQIVCLIFSVLVFVENHNVYDYFYYWNFYIKKKIFWVTKFAEFYYKTRKLRKSNYWSHQAHFKINIVFVSGLVKIFRSYFIKASFVLKLYTKTLL